MDVHKFCIEALCFRVQWQSLPHLDSQSQEEPRHPDYEPVSLLQHHWRPRKCTLPDRTPEYLEEKIQNLMVVN